MTTSESGSGEVLVEGPQPCASCGVPAHIVLKDGQRICARCYRNERMPQPGANAPR